MAITRDQLSSVTTANTTASSFTITFPTLPTAGSSVIVAIGFNSSSVSISSVKDNGTSQSTFTQDVTETGSANHISYIYRADGISLPGSGSYTITVTLSGSNTFSASAGAASYLGKAAGGPVSTNVATATSSSITTNNGTPTVAGSLFAATFQDNSGGTADNPTVTNGNFTSQLVNGNGGTGQVFGFADQIKTGTAADACTWSVATSATYSAVIAVYSPAAVTADVPQIQPGPVWLEMFKPGLPRPRPYQPVYTETETGALAIVLPVPATALSGLDTLRLDQLAANPGPAWLDQFKPGLRKPRPPVTALSFGSNGGAFTITLPVPLLSLTGLDTLPLSQPQVQPGPAWLDQFKPGLPRPRPPLPFPPTKTVTAPLSLPLPVPLLRLSGTRLRSPENLGAVLTLPGPAGVTTEVTEGATCTLPGYGGTIALVTLNASTVGWTMQTAPLNLLEFNDVTIDIAITQNGSPYNLTGVTVNMLFKTQAGTPDSSALIFSSGGGSPAITITSAVGGLAVAQIPNTDLDSEVYFFYRIDVVSGGFTNTCLSGPITWTSL